MKIEENIIDYKENSSEIKKWISLKGHQKYCEFIKLLQKDNIKCSWKNVSNLYKYSKRLQLTLFKYISFFEEYIRAKIWNDDKKVEYINLNRESLFGLIDYVCQNNISYSNVDREKLLDIKELRNNISHNDIVFLCERNGNDYKKLIINFYTILPQEYRLGFKNDIKKCSKDLETDNCFLINL